MPTRETLEFIAATTLKLAEMAEGSRDPVLGYLLRMAAEAAIEEVKHHAAERQGTVGVVGGDADAPI